MFGLGLIGVLVGVAALAGAPRSDMPPEDQAALVNGAWILVGLGAGLLLLSRRPFGYFCVFAVGGGALHVTVLQRPWGPPDWHSRIVLVSVVLVALGVALPLMSGVRDTVTAGRLLALSGVGLVAAHRYLLPEFWQERILDAVVVIAVCWVALRLRSDELSKVGFTVAVAGIGSFVLVRLHITPALPEQRYIIIAGTLTLFGVAANLWGHVTARSYDLAAMMAFLWSAVAWATGRWSVTSPVRDQLGLGTEFRSAADVVGAALLVFAAAAVAVTFAVEVCEARDTLTSRLGSYVLLIVIGSLGLGVAVIGTVVRLRYQLPGEPAIALLAAVGAATVVMALWIAAAISVDASLDVPRDRQDSPTYLAEVAVRSVVTGPRGLGDGPFLGYAGTALTLSASWTWYGVILGALGTLALIGGATRLSIQLLARLRESGLGTDEHHHQLLRVFRHQLDDHDVVVPLAVMCTGTALALMSVSANQAAPLSLRLTLAVVAAAGLLAATVPAGILLIGADLLARGGLEAGVSVRDTVRDADADNAAVKLAIGAGVAVLCAVLLVSFDVSGFWEAFLMLAGVAGVGYGFVMGWRPLNDATTRLLTAKETLADRLDRISTGARKVYHLLPAARE